MEYIVSGIYIYPIKSLGGISLTESYIEPRGLQYDRRWMLCNEQHQFISQREIKELALFKISLKPNFFVVQYKNEPSFIIPFSIKGNAEMVKIWDDECFAIEYANASNWFSKILNFPCKLFYMPNETERKVNKKYAFHNEITSFSDGYPILIAGQESLNFLNNKLKKAIEMDRFRPNIVFTGGMPFEEDNFDGFNIGENHFKIVKACERCIIITIDQKTTETSAEPLKTLATFRNINNKILFGQNVIVTQIGSKVKKGDSIVIHPTVC
jgi:hypothetical protein